MKKYNSQFSNMVYSAYVVVKSSINEQYTSGISIIFLVKPCSCYGNSDYLDVSLGFQRDQWAELSDCSNTTLLSAPATQVWRSLKFSERSATKN